MSAVRAWMGEAVRVIPCTDRTRRAQWYRLLNDYPSGVLLADAADQRLFVSYADLAARLYRCTGSPAATAIMDAARAWATHAG